MALDVQPSADGGGVARRGSLRVYLGPAPGVGKTYSMLAEGRRRSDRGADVVVGFVETYGREHTAEQLGDLEVLPRRHVTVHGLLTEDLDLDAVLRRRPDVCLVDELAHTNAPGGRHAHRWEDVEEILAQGIDVVTTLNVCHLESVNDVVEGITGVRQVDTIPDGIVRNADQVELVDSTPEALRRRLAHGNIFGPDDLDATRATYFQPENLAALRELTLLWVADQVEVGLTRHRVEDAIPLDTRERVVVAVTGAPGTDGLIRRAARMAQRSRGTFVGVHVTTRGEARASEAAYGYQRLVTSLGGEFYDVAGDDVAGALVEFARSHNATQLVLGAADEPWWRRISGTSVVGRVVRESGAVDVHVVSRGSRAAGTAPPSWPPRTRSALPLRRVAAGFVAALVGVPLLTLALAQVRAHTGLPTVLLLFLTLVVATATIGGTVPAVIAAVVSFLAANWYFTPPYHRFSIAERDHVVALLVFLGVALVVSRFVDSAARRGVEAARARSEAHTLAALAATVTAGDPLPPLLDHLRSVFGFGGAAVLEHAADGWVGVAHSGDEITVPRAGDVQKEITEGTVLVARGGRLSADDHRVLNAFAARLAASLEHRRLAAEAAQAGALAEANALRTALLQAVSHDLRTPLASIKASATSLTQDDVEWSKDETREFLATITEETDRLTALVGNLLDMSRIQAGAVQPAIRSVALDEVVPAALMSLNVSSAVVTNDVAETLPPVRADAALLERVLANVVQNALRYSPPDQPVRIDARDANGAMYIRVVDRGPGIPAAERDRVFQPFQRLNDNRMTTGVGLGLAVANGFMAAMGGRLTLEDTPGGGTTVSMILPVAT